MRRLSARAHSRNLAWARLDPLKTNVHPVSHKRRHCFNGSLSGLVLMRRSMFLLFAPHTLSMRKRAFRPLGLLWAMEVASLHFVRLMANEAPGVVASAIGAVVNVAGRARNAADVVGRKKRLWMSRSTTWVRVRHGGGHARGNTAATASNAQIAQSRREGGGLRTPQFAQGPTHELYSRSLTRETPNPRVGEGAR